MVSKDSIEGKFSQWAEIRYVFCMEGKIISDMDLQWLIGSDQWFANQVNQGLKKIRFEEQWQEGEVFDGSLRIGT